MKNKQTAVEWLKEELINSLEGYEVKFGTLIKIKKQFDQAKEMEKDQIVDAHYEGQCNNTEGYPIEISKQYYNDTYGKQTNAG